MIRWLINLFRRKPRYAFGDDCPYTRSIAAEVFRTGEGVAGKVLKNGDPELEYADGSRRILSRAEVLKRGSP